MIKALLRVHRQINRRMIGSDLVSDWVIESLYLLLHTNFHERKDKNKIKSGHVWATGDKGS